MFKNNFVSKCNLDYYALFRFSIVFLIALMILMVSHTQAKPLKSASIKVDNVTLHFVFNELRNQTGYHFLYLKDDLDVAHKVSLTFKDTPLEDILRYCFINQPLTYKIQHNRVLVERKISTKLSGFFK